MAEERTDAQKSEPMLRVLQWARDGMLLAEMEEAQRNVTALVRSRGKPGKVVLEICIRPPSKKSGERAQTLVTFEVIEKAPRPDLEAEFYYVTEGGGLSRDMPEKGYLGFSKVAKSEDDGKAERA